MGKATVQDAASTPLLLPSLPMSGIPGVLSAVGALPELLTVPGKKITPSGRLLAVWKDLDSVSASESDPQSSPGSCSECCSGP